MNEAVRNEEKIEHTNQKALHEMKGEYMDIKVPEHGLSEMQKRMEDAKRDKRMNRRQKRIRYFGTAVAAALVLFILPNTNAGIAHAMGNIPLLGNLFKVITVRDYYYEDDTHLITARVPQIQASSEVEKSVESVQDSADAVSAEAAQQEKQDVDLMSIRETQETIEALNAEIIEYVDVLLKEFEADMVKEGHQSLEIDYTTITDTENWFTLEINAAETAASGYEFRKYYHFDKVSGEIVTLKDLMQNDAEGMQALNEEIKRQMQEQMGQELAVYFMKSAEDPNGFEKVSETQNFYFNNDGQLVIVFDEYEVAPGSQGCPEFVIPDEVWRAE